MLAADLGFVEGPTVLATGDIVVTSIDRGKVYLVSPETGARELADLGGGANGATVALDGTIYVAQNGGRWAANGPVWPSSSVGGVQIIRPDGSHDWLTREPIAPNDLCFGPDGMLYVTDPTRSRKIQDGRIWRIHPETGAAELLRSVPFFSNGIAFDSDDRMYLASTQESRIYRAELTESGISEPELVIRLGGRWPDGLAFDSAGRLVVGAVEHDGQGTIQTWSPEGELIDEYFPGAGALFTNIAFDGKGGLIIAASDRGEVLLVPDWGDPGLPLHPFR